MTLVRRLFNPSEAQRAPLRQLDPLRDLEAVAELVEVAFRDEPGRDRDQFRSELRSLRGLGPVLWSAARLSPVGGDLLTGYVFEAGGRIVGCLTLSRLPGNPTRWLIANVAVHPSHRRRGIARRLMEATILHVHERGGGLVVLDVRRENAPAYRLYESLGFAFREETTERRWFPGFGWPCSAPGGQPNPFRPLAHPECRAARELLYEAVAPAAREAAPVVDTDLLAYGLFGGLLTAYHWLNGRDVIRLGAFNGEVCDGLVVLRAARWAGLHTLQITLRPERAAELAVPAVQAALERLRRYQPLPTTTSLRSPAPELVAALDALGFQERQTLHRLALRVDA